MTGLWVVVMLGVTTETPDQATVVATAVVRPHSDHARSRLVMGPG
jgi:hypothetical protein